MDTTSCMSAATVPKLCHRKGASSGKLSLLLLSSNKAFSRVPGFIKSRTNCSITLLLAIEASQAICTAPHICTMPASNHETTSHLPPVLAVGRNAHAVLHSSFGTSPFNMLKQLAKTAAVRILTRSTIVACCSISSIIILSTWNTA